MSKITRLGNDLYTGRKSIDFVGRRWLWYSISGLIVVVALLGITVKGFNWGIEFTGGAEFRVTVPGQSVSQDEVDQVREKVAGTGIDAASAPVVSSSGTDTILVQTEPLTDAESQELTGVILDLTGGTESDLSQSEIGPSWGQEVAQRALLGLGVFLVLVVLFIWAYFREWKMSVAALVALAHDLVITAGVYALSGFEVSPATVTGLLTILGFSLYDTVVVFDKVRENTKDLRARRTTYAAAANLAVNQTLVRSINTSIVALIPVGCILYVGVVQLGSGAMKDLALALFVGMAAGVYSSIFIATPLVAHLKSTEDEVKAAERRAKARERQQADRYASVPTFSEDMPIADEPGAAADDTRGAPVGGSGATGTSGARPEASGRGRVAPAARSPLQQSSASGRQQPTRQPRSKRGKK
jgi:preprotein translocase subunit SecF